MKGSYTITVSTKRIEYELTINRNITIIKGDSATGKTNLINLIERYYEYGNQSGIKLKCDRTCMVIGGKDWRKLLTDVHNTIIFIDEGNNFTKSHDFANEVRESDNYFVLITREDLKSLPYSVNEIYGLKQTGSKKVGEKVYNSLYQLYGELKTSSRIVPTLVITEDSNAGFDFFDSVLDIKCIPGKGRDRLIEKIVSRPDQAVLLIGDGAAFGCSIDLVLVEMSKYSNYTLYLPESFEWLVLKSEIIKDNQIKEILENPSKYIESKEHFSWERFFNSLLENVTTDNPYVQQYNKKRKLPKAFKVKENAIKILKTIPSNIVLSTKHSL